MARITSPHTQSLLIAALANRGHWSGQRRGIHISLTLQKQADFEGQRIDWTAYTLGSYRQRVKGRAGTVAEALLQIERTIPQPEG